MKVVLLLLIASSLCYVNDVREFYPIAIGIAKGLAKSSEQKCANVLRTNTDKIVEAIEKAIQDASAGRDITEIALELVELFLGIDGFTDNCNVFAILDLVEKITTKEGYKEILENIIKNIDQIWENGSKIVPKAKEHDYEGAGEAGGKIINLSTGFYVY